MILIDTGPLFAILNKRDDNHKRCVQALADVTTPLLTTWPVLTEAMYLLQRVDGWKGQQLLWQIVEREVLQVVDLSTGMMKRMAQLMAQYQDTPMDLADASLVALAMERGLSKIISLDQDFEVYRLAKGKGFTIIPQ